MSLEKPTATEVRCRPLLSDDDIRYIYQNAKPSTKGGGKKAARDNSYADMGRRFGIRWSDAQCIAIGYAFDWITGATAAARKDRLEHSAARSDEEIARSRLDDKQVRFIRDKARPGPLHPNAPLTYASLGKTYGLQERVVRAIKLRKILADVPDTDPQDQQPTPANAGNHWM